MDAAWNGKRRNCLHKERSDRTSTISSFEKVFFEGSNPKTRDLSEESSTNLLIGKAVIAQTEISSWTGLMKETLDEFNLHSEDDFEKGRLENSVIDETEGSANENLHYDSIDSDD